MAKKKKAAKKKKTAKKRKTTKKITRKKTGKKKKTTRKKTVRKAAKKKTKKTAKKKKTTGKKRKPNAAFMKPLVPSAALAAVIGKAALPRTQVIKKLWDYIKSNGLQDSKDKRNINTDSNLKKVFGKNQVSMFKMAKLLNKHLT